MVGSFDKAIAMNVVKCVMNDSDMYYYYLHGFVMKITSVKADWRRLQVTLCHLLCVLCLLLFQQNSGKAKNFV